MTFTDYDVAERIVRTIFTEAYRSKHISQNVRTYGFGETLYVLEKMITALYYSGCHALNEITIFGASSTDPKKSDLQYTLEAVRANRVLARNALDALVEVFVLKQTS